jgi:outer membrane protein TolC
VYYQLYQSRKIVELASGRLAAAQKQQEQTETLLSAGRVRPLELTLAKAAALSSRQELLVAQEQEKLAETELRELTGLGPSVSVGTVEPVVESPIFGLRGETLYQQALECSPAILQSEANVKAREFHVEAEKGERLPRADILGQYALFSRTNNFQDFFNRFSRHNFVLGLSLQVPIFSGSRISSRVAQSRQEVSEARHRLDSLKSGLRLDIERALSALRVAQGASELARMNAEAAREALQVTEALLEGGRIGPKEIEEFRSQLQQREMASLEADQALFERKIDLLRVLGSISSALQ